MWQPKEVSITSPNDGTTWSSGLSWSGGSVTNPTFGFDSSTTTTASGGTSGTLTWTPPSAISGNLQISVPADPSGTSTITLSDSTQLTVTSDSFADFGTVTNITSVTVTRGNNSGMGIKAVKLDGVILVDGVNEYGTNGFSLDFSDNSSNTALGTDSSGENNNWSVNNLVADAPTVQYGADTGNSNFDSSATSLTYDTTGFSYSTVLSPKTDTGQANASTVLKTSDGSSVAWTFSTDSTDRYIWTSSNGINWSSPGTVYDTDVSPQTVTSAWVAWAGGSNVSVLTITFSDVSDIDSLTDSPTNGTQTDTGAGGEVVSNYATLNPLSRYSALVPSDGNLVFTDDNSSNGGDQGIQATIMPTSGSYYWEVTPTALASENYYGVSKQNKLTQTVWTGGAIGCLFLL